MYHALEKRGNFSNGILILKQHLICRQDLVDVLVLLIAEVLLIQARKGDSDVADDQRLQAVERGVMAS